MSTPKLYALALLYTKHGLNSVSTEVRARACIAYNHHEACAYGRDTARQEWPNFERDGWALEVAWNELPTREILERLGGA